MFLGLKSSVIFILTVTIKKQSEPADDCITDYFLREKIPNDVYCWFVLIWEGASAAFFFLIFYSDKVSCGGFKKKTVRKKKKTQKEKKKTKGEEKEEENLRKKKNLGVEHFGQNKTEQKKNENEFPFVMCSKQLKAWTLISLPAATQLQDPPPSLLTTPIPLLRVAARQRWTTDTFTRDCLPPGGICIREAERPKQEVR